MDTNNSTIPDIQKKIAAWEESKGRVMKSYLPTQDILFLLQMSERIEDKSSDEEEFLAKIRELIKHAVDMLIVI